MSEKTLPPWVKPLLEIGPVILFFVVYFRIKDQTFTIAGTDYAGFILATAIFVPIMVLSTLLLWRLTGKLSAMQIVSVGLVVVFGGLSIWLNDPRFLKMKPTILYALFGGVLGVGLLRGQAWLRPVMGEALSMTDTGWRLLTQRVCGFFFALALANEVIWRNLSEANWVSFKTFGMPLALMVFFVAQSGLIGRHALPEEDDPKT